MMLKKETKNIFKKRLTKGIKISQKSKKNKLQKYDFEEKERNKKHPSFFS